MAVNPTGRASARGRAAARTEMRRPSRSALKALRTREPSGEPLEYPASLLRHPSTAMFLLMREAFRLAQQRVAGAESAQEQMRFPHFATLACLEEFGSASQREISERLRLDPSDLVGFVDWLEAAGFVERKRDERDRRRYAVELTAAGRRAFRARVRASDRTNADLFAPLTPQEQEQLREFLLRALRPLERAGPQGGNRANR